jgi:membrane protease YdiL (CAAX protease family)
MATLTQQRSGRLSRDPLVYGLALVVLFSLLRAAVGALSQRLFGDVGLELTWAGGLFWLGVFVLMSLGLVAGGIVGLGGVGWRELGWRRKGLLKAIGLGVLGAVGLFVLQLVYMLAVIALFGPPPGGIPAPEPLSLGGYLASLVWGFAIASWQEENLFRGYLQPLLIARLGTWGGIAAQAALFGVAHIGWLADWRMFGLVFLVGLVLGSMRGRDRSLVAPFIAHGLIG